MKAFLLALLVALSLLPLTQPADAQAPVRSALDEIYRSYVRAQTARDVQALVRLDHELRSLIGPSEQPWDTEGGIMLEVSPEDERLGIAPLLFDPAYVTLA